MEAEQRYRRAIQLNANLAQAHVELSGALKWLGRRQESLEHGTRALQLEPLSVSINNSVGYTLDEMGRFDEAAVRYRRAIEIDPQSPTAYLISGLSSGLYVESFR